MIALGVVSAVCMVVIAVMVWRRVNKLLCPGDGEGPGGGGPDPMDRPGDGSSPHDLFLQQLLRREDLATTGHGG